VEGIQATPPSTDLHGGAGSASGGGPMLTAFVIGAIAAAAGLMAQARTRRRRR